MAFIIDSSEWDFNSLDTQSISQKLERLLERVDIANDRGELIYVGNDLQSQCVSGSMDFWSFIYGPSMADIDIDLIAELSAFLNSANYYEDDSTLWPIGFPLQAVVDKDGNELSLDLAFAHFNILSNRPFGCISLNPAQNLETHSQSGCVNVALVGDEMSHKNFWRCNALTILRDTEINLETLSAHMYPNIHFLENVWRGINDFNGGYARVSQSLQKYLAGLDDFGAWIFTEPPPAIHPTDSITEYTGLQPTNAIIEQRFSGIGLEMAPENPNVFKDNKCRKARERVFQPDLRNNQLQTLYCEWHGKLEKHTNRIHVHAPVNGSNGKVIIAIYHEHLPLPN